MEIPRYMFVSRNVGGGGKRAVVTGAYGDG